MERKELAILIEKLITEIEKLVPSYLANPINANISKGNPALCIIDPDGNVRGKLFGTDKNKQREFFRVAWIKASQVHITGMKTGEFEKLVFTNQVDENKFGISKPDLIGWEGGQPIKVDDQTTLAVGFSGFQGMHDLEIVVKAFEQIT